MPTIDVLSYIICTFCRVKIRRESRMCMLAWKLNFASYQTRDIIAKYWSLSESLFFFFFFTRAKQKYADTLAVWKFTRASTSGRGKAGEGNCHDFLHNEQLARAFYQFRLSAVENKYAYSRVFRRMKIGGAKRVKDRRMCKGVNIRDWIVLQYDHLYRLSAACYTLRICEIRNHAYKV